MQLSEIDQQIADLQAQKAKLIEDEKKSAMQKVKLALQELNALGFNYSLTEGTTSTRTRRTGVRDAVLKAVQSGNGMKSAEIATQLDMDDTKGKQSVANALAALKKAGTVTAENGRYSAK